MGKRPSMPHYEPGSDLRKSIEYGKAYALRLLAGPGLALLAAHTISIQAADADGSAEAFGGSLDGRFLYERACGSCHANGFNGAPRLVASDWPQYKQVGLEAYTLMAIEGVGIMPARGGQSDMSDEQVRRAMQYMLDRLEDH